MTDPVTQEPDPVPEPMVVDPCPATVRNGQCAADGISNHQQQQAKTPTEPGSFTVNQEMKITDSADGEGLLESSLRLKPHEAQDYRKKALWVSWISIVVTLILAVAAFRSRSRTAALLAQRFFGDLLRLPVHL
ncbi:Transmembrane protein 163 [Oryzias melastigma]|uniref:Transmembrane protein 163 n=1 Tax=Oryzias melastigma TaxID=30732 RepID=A0A834CPC6_ORYME|nr:Transmembrane protein 163 [Oryzias melastigma]